MEIALQYEMQRPDRRGRLPRRPGRAPQLLLRGARRLRGVDARASGTSPAAGRSACRAPRLNTEQGREHTVKIRDVTVTELRASPADGERPAPAGRFIVQVHSDEGLTGIAEGTGNAGVFRAYLAELIKPLIVGMDPLRPRRIWEVLRLGHGEQGTRFPSRIVGPIDVACWDIVGKAAGLPLHALLGGRGAPRSPSTGAGATGGARVRKRCWRRSRRDTRGAFAPSRCGWIGATTGRTATRPRTSPSSSAAGSGCPTTCR